MIYWVFYTAGISTLALVFALSAWHKLSDFPRFKASLGAYRLFPESFVGLVAPFVIFLELAAIVELLLPLGAGSWLAFALLCLYTLAITVNLLRGSRQIDCGCGDRPTPLSGWLLLRNATLLLLALVLALPQDPVATEPVFAAWALVAVLVLMMLLFYLIVEQLLANQFMGESHNG